MSFLLWNTLQRKRAVTFNPSAYGTVRLWLDFTDSSKLFQMSDGTVPANTNGDVIGYVKDKSSNLYHHVQATSARKPTYIANGLAGYSVARFDGTDDWLDYAGGILQVAAYTMVVVRKASNTAVVNTNYNSGSAPPHTIGLNIATGSARFAVRDNTGSEIAGGTFDVPATNNVWNIHSMRRNGNNFYQRINGGSDGTNTTSLGAITIDSHRVGASQTGALPMAGDIAMVIYYDGYISDSTLSALVAELNDWFGVY